MEKSKTGPAHRSAVELNTRPRSNRAILVVAAMDMSWRLAIAVLVPIIGGYELDKHLRTTPALTIIGFIVAMAGLFFILKRTLDEADQKFNTRAKQ
jgi:F0F1-type ATP synthase assembly protein I